MPEILLHYIWQSGLFLQYPQETTDGRKIEILSLGQHNLDAGPDFMNVRIRIENKAVKDNGTSSSIELVGNVEIHVNSSDWYNHHHQNDSAYDSIILHVVKHADKEVRNSQGEILPQMEINYPSNRDYLEMMVHDAKNMDSALSTRWCSQRLLDDPSLLTNGWRRTMLMRRLTCKQESISRLLQLTKNDWRQAFYISMAHYFGFHTNGVPMELVAIQTPLSVLDKHRDNLVQLTALLLGQANLIKDDTSEVLQQEYHFLRTKYDLQPIDGSLWKYARLRPDNRPEIRIQQFARLIAGVEFLLSMCLETEDINALRAIFTATGMGARSADVLIVNVVVPFLYARGKEERAMSLLESIPAEDNRIIRQWKMLGQEVHDAADTQALIHLYQTCCEQGQCLQCDVAYRIFFQKKQ